MEESCSCTLVQGALMQSSQPIIELSHLTKDYGKGRGAFDISFSVEPGQAFGFLGPNGAGKTVTMRNLMGFIQPDSGLAQIKGKNCFTQRALIQSSLGYLPGEIACMDEMTGIAFLNFMARMKNISNPSRMNELIDYFELDAKSKIRKMSKGTKQKVGLICAFMSQPEILLLDEPTSGLDPLMQSKFIDLVLEEKKKGTTIFLSSHIFEEIERTCDRVAFIRKGHLIAVDSMESIQQTRKHIYSITFQDQDDCVTYLKKHPSACKTGCETIEIPVEGCVDAFLKNLATYRVYKLFSRTQTLEELFMHFYESDTKGGSHE